MIINFFTSTFEPPAAFKLKLSLWYTKTSMSRFPVRENKGMWLKSGIVVTLEQALISGKSYDEMASCPIWSRVNP